MGVYNNKGQKHPERDTKNTPTHPMLDTASVAVLVCGDLKKRYKADSGYRTALLQPKISSSQHTQKASEQYGLESTPYRSASKVSKNYCLFPET